MIVFVVIGATWSMRPSWSSDAALALSGQPGSLTVLVGSRVPRDRMVGRDDLIAPLCANTEVDVADDTITIVLGEVRRRNAILQLLFADGCLHGSLHGEYYSRLSLP